MALTRGPDLSRNGGHWDAFVARVASDGRELEYCGYIGGADTDIAFSIDVDGRDRAYVVGTTRSEGKTFPVKRGPELVFGLSPYMRYRIAHESSRMFKPYVKLVVRVGRREAETDAAQASRQGAAEFSRPAALHLEPEALRQRGAQGELGVRREE